MLGDVDAGTDVADEIAVRPEMRRAAFEQPAPGAVFALQAEFHFVRPPRVECGVVCVQRAIEIGRMHVIAPAVADLLLDIAADEIEPALVEPVATLVLATHPYEHRRRVRRRAKALLALAQGFLGANAAGDIANEGAEHQFVAESYGRDGQLHRKFVPVAMERGHFDAFVEHARDARFRVAAQAFAMFLARPLGNDELRELASHDFGTSPAEQFFGLGIPAGDHAVGVDRDHAIECGFDDELVTLLREAKPTFGGATQRVGAFSARGVHHHEGHEHDDARQRKYRNRGLEAEQAATLDVKRERAGQQRYHDRGRQQSSRHATADSIARKQARHAGILAQRKRAGGKQQEQDCGVHRHVGKREQGLAAEHETRQAKPTQQQRHDREHLVQHGRAWQLREPQRET